MSLDRCWCVPIDHTQPADFQYLGEPAPARRAAASHDAPSTGFVLDPASTRRTAACHRGAVLRYAFSSSAQAVFLGNQRTVPGSCAMVRPGAFSRYNPFKSARMTPGSRSTGFRMSRSRSADRQTEPGVAPVVLRLSAGLCRTISQRLEHAIDRSRDTRSSHGRLSVPTTIWH